MFRDELKYSYIKLGCQHAGTYRCSSKGLRPAQISAKMECPARIVASASVDGEKLVIREVVTDHNHKMSSEAFARTPQQRKLTSDELAVMSWY